jgi:hypothetical protein
MSYIKLFEITPIDMVYHSESLAAANILSSPKQFMSKGIDESSTKEGTLRVNVSSLSAMSGSPIGEVLENGVVEQKRLIGLPWSS